MNARSAAILIALCLLVGIVGFSSMLSEAIGVSGGGGAGPPGTSTPGGNLTGGTAEMVGTSLAPTAPDEETTPAPTVTPNEYIEQDTTLLPEPPAPSHPPTSPVTTAPTPPGATATSSPTPTDTDRAPPAADPATTVRPAGPAPTSVHISAENEDYSPSSITVQAGSEVTIVFENQDVDIPHNVMIYADKDDPIFVGTIVKGPGKTTDTFIAPSTPGTYTMGCIYPAPHRKGTFIVE